MMKFRPILHVLIAFCVCFAISSQAAQESSATHQALETEKGELHIYPIEHATFVMKWDGKTIFVDPVGGAEAFEKQEEPDLVLITDIHPDHLNLETLHAVVKEKTQVVAPASVNEKLPEELKKKTVVMANGEKKETMGFQIEAIPMYNLTQDRMKFHEKGRGNGYVLTIGGKRIYISGDTEDIPEMRQLKKIDAAFVCMNLPYTMTVEQAADAVLAFHPKIVYPYHYRGSDVEKFKQLIGEDAGVEVRLLKWYPDKESDK